MSFFWGSPKAKESESLIVTPPSSAREFAENTKEKDLELQAILEGTSIAAPAVTAVPPAPAAKEKSIPSAAAGSKDKKARPSARATSGTVKKETDTKLVPEPKLWFGVPRKYIVVVIVTIFMLTVIFRLMSNIWGATDINTEAGDGSTAPEPPEKPEVKPRAGAGAAHSHLRW